MLESRADALKILKEGKFDKAKTYEQKMTDYKTEHLDELMRPQYAIIIFQTEAL